MFIMLTKFDKLLHVVWYGFCCCFFVLCVRLYAGDGLSIYTVLRDIFMLLDQKLIKALKIYGWKTRRMRIFLNDRWWHRFVFLTFYLFIFFFSYAILVCILKICTDECINDFVNHRFELFGQENPCSPPPKRNFSLKFLILQINSKPKTTQLIKRGSRTERKWTKTIGQLFNSGLVRY